MPRAAQSALPRGEHLAEGDVVEVLVEDAGLLGVVEALGLPRDGDPDVVATEVPEPAVVLGDPPPLVVLVVREQRVDRHHGEPAVTHRLDAVVHEVVVADDGEIRRRLDRDLGRGTTVGPVAEPAVRTVVVPRHRGRHLHPPPLEQARGGHRAHHPRRVLRAFDAPERGHVGVLAVLRHRCGEVGEHDERAHDLGVEHLPGRGDQALVVQHRLDPVDVHLARRHPVAPVDRHRHQLVVDHHAHGVG